MSTSKKLAIMYVPNGLVRRCFFPGEEEGELPGFVGGFNADKIKRQLSHSMKEDQLNQISQRLHDEN